MLTLINTLFPRRATLARYRRALQVERAARVEAEQARDSALACVEHYRARAEHLEREYRMALADNTAVVEWTAKGWPS